MCLLDVFRSIPGIQERGLSLEDHFRSRYLYDQKEVVQTQVSEEEEEIPLFTKGDSNPTEQCSLVCFDFLRNETPFFECTFLHRQPPEMEVINPNGVKVYNLSTGKSFPKVSHSSGFSRNSS